MVIETNKAEPGGLRKEGSTRIVICLEASLEIAFMPVLGNVCCDVVGIGCCLVDVVVEFEVIVLLRLVIGDIGNVVDLNMACDDCVITCKRSHNKERFTLRITG